jgi:hypothetical protein
MQIARHFLAAKHLFVAVEVGLFETLAQRPATLAELAQQLGIPGVLCGLPLTPRSP